MHATTYARQLQSFAVTLSMRKWTRIFGSDQRAVLRDKLERAGRHLELAGPDAFDYLSFHDLGAYQNVREKLAKPLDGMIEADLKFLADQITSLTVRN